MSTRSVTYPTHEHEVGDLPIPMSTRPVAMMRASAKSLATVKRSWMRVAQRTLNTLMKVRIAVTRR